MEISVLQHETLDRGRNVWENLQNTWLSWGMIGKGWYKHASAFAQFTLYL